MIHGKAREVIELIDELAYGPGSTPGVAERRDWWRSQFEQNLCFSAQDFLHAGQAALPEFGEKAPGIDYLLRPGAYAVICDKHRRIAVVRAGQGVFLPGGGSEPGEIPEDTLRREVGEECGRQVRILGKIGEALSHLFAPGEGRHYTIHGHFYRAAFGKMTHEPIESDHYLAWLELPEAVENLRPDQAWAVNQANAKKGSDQ
jgi:8-oxo-dGTP pyrophosphatase MutT (NUDIX family)